MRESEAARVVVIGEPHWKELVGEHPVVRDLIVGSCAVFAVSAVLLLLHGWWWLGWHVALVCFTSFAYHIDLEGRRYGFWDQVAATTLFGHVLWQSFLLSEPLILLPTTVGYTLWKLGHKCHCTDRRLCGHPYESFQGICHALMHIVAGVGPLVVLNNRSAAD